MPIYRQQGSIPPKRHTQFRKPDGGLYYEQLFGTVGFEGMATLMYHLHRPTEVKSIGNVLDVTPEMGNDLSLKMRKLIGFNLPSREDYLESRALLLVNQDVRLGVAAPGGAEPPYFYKNAEADELLFVHRGTGVLATMLGDIPFAEGDYLIIPRGVIYRMRFNGKENRLFYLESLHPLYTPARYRNHFGQMQEHAPFCERDYKLPVLGEAREEKGDFLVKVKKGNRIHHLVYAWHPFDVVGWDGFNYPWGLSIHDFEPITGRVHQPPPVHQTFHSAGFVVCSFCPRLFDYHPLAIPAPYNHSNIDSDEVIYYVDGDFMSRNDVAPGHITLHPGGIPHGPHPGAAERSIGQKETRELAVMVDTFRPLYLTQAALGLDDGKYYASWQE